MTASVIAGIFFLSISNGGLESYPDFFLLPWLSGLAVIMIIPSAILYFQGKFSIADPLIFATWSYFFPAFVIGGFFFAVGWSRPAFTALIQDAKNTLPLTIILVGLGFIGLSAGYLLPIGSGVGRYIAKKLPIANFSNSSLIIPSAFLLVLGVFNTVIAFGMGIFGFQRLEQAKIYDGLIFMTTLIWIQATFLLWVIIFRQNKWSLTFVPVLTLLLGTSLVKVLFAGNRSSIIQIFTVIVLAFVLSGRRFKFRQSVIAGVLLSAGLLVGMIYGTTFRNIKGTESQQSAKEYFENISTTFEQIGSNNPYESISDGFSSLTERIDILSTLAVVVSSYEELKPFEEAYGLDNNIWSDLTTFFIPRILWNDKPSASDPRKYSDLYFSYGESSFAITSIGDLLRNFGMVGVPVGMFLLGIILRFIYSSLIEGQKRVTWRLTFYFMLLTSVSYEGFFGPIIPQFFRVGLITAVSLLIVNFFAKKETLYSESLSA
ncbi:MAG: hypothetical protein ABIO54_11320 [Pyrinomonadaceae bacterium]